jgi:hypothetical protein
MLAEAMTPHPTAARAAAINLRFIGFFLTE